MKGRAFEPSKIDKSTSVFRIQGLTNDRIWGIGSKYVAIPQNRNLHARADIAARVINRSNLRIQPKEPPPRHASIIDWPVEKHLKISIAQELAAEASLRLPSTT